MGTGQAIPIQCRVARVLRCRKDDQRRRFEQYADYLPSDERSVGGQVPPDVRLPQGENADEFFMEDLYMDSEEERQASRRTPHRLG